MRHIALPDPLYAEAQKAAALQGVSLERFVREAVRLYLKDESAALKLAPEQAESLRAAIAEADAGYVLTPSEAEAEHQAMRRDWIKDKAS